MPRAVARTLRARKRLVAFTTKALLFTLIFLCRKPSKQAEEILHSISAVHPVGYALVGCITPASETTAVLERGHEVSISPDTATSPAEQDVRIMSCLLVSAACPKPQFPRQVSAALRPNPNQKSVAAL